MVHSDDLGQGRGVGVANVRPAVRLNADTKVADPNFQLGTTDDVGSGLDQTAIDLCGVLDRGVLFVVERDEEDTGDLRGRR